MSIKDLHLLTRGNIWSLEKPVGTPLHEFSLAECLNLLENPSTPLFASIFPGPPTVNEKFTSTQFEKPEDTTIQYNHPFSFKDSIPHQGSYEDKISANSRFFVIKLYNFEQASKAYQSYSWSSTPKVNRKLANAYKTLGAAGKLFLFMSVNGSGKFCAVAEITSVGVRNNDLNIDSGDEEGNERVLKHGQRQKTKQKNKQKGVEKRKQDRTEFQLRWWRIIDIANKQLKHLRVPSNGNRPVTNSRDTQELPLDVGQAMLDIFQGKQC